MGGDPAVAGDRVTPSSFALPEEAGHRGGTGGGPDRATPGLRSLSELSARARPSSLAFDRLLPVDPALAPLFEGAGLRRGSTLVLGGAARTSLALALAARASRDGFWVMAVGAPWLGARAAAQLGVDPERLVLVPDPGDQWPVVVAAVLEVADLVVLGLPGTGARPADSRRLVARARERGSVLVLLPAAGAGAFGLAAGARAGLEAGPFGPGDLRSTAGAREEGRFWPEPPDLRLEVGSVAWEGLGKGHGHLRSRVVTVVSTGRRGAARPRLVKLWLSGPDGRPSVWEPPVGTEARGGPGPAVAGPAVAGLGVAGPAVAGPGVAGPAVAGPAVAVGT